MSDTKIDALQEAIVILEQALKFYADGENFNVLAEAKLIPVNLDRGATARLALDKLYHIRRNVKID